MRPGRRHPRGAGFLLLATAFGAAAQTGFAALPVPPSAGIDQHPGAKVPTDLTLVDEAGTRVLSGALFADRPVALAFAYFGCPNLCSLTLQDLAAAVAGSGLKAGKDLDVVVVSFDPRDDAAAAAAKKAQLVAAANGAQAGVASWRFLTGEGAATSRLADAVGYRYAFDATQGEYRHASAVVLLTPAGRVARYLLGLGFAPRDLRLAASEAAAGAIGSPVDQILLYCYHYDATTGRYAPTIALLLKAVGLASLLALGGAVLAAARTVREPAS